MKGWRNENNKRRRRCKIFSFLISKSMYIHTAYTKKGNTNSGCAKCGWRMEKVTQMLLSTFSFLLFPFLFLYANPPAPNLHHFSFNIISFKLWELYLAQKREKKKLRYCFDMNFINANILYKVPYFFCLSSSAKLGCFFWWF